MEYDSLVYASPITFTGALEDQTFALAAPGVLQNITAPPGFTVAVLNSSQPADGCGAATVAPDGGLSLVPVHNFFGGCNFSFAMLDNGGQYMERTVVVSFGEILAAFGWRCGDVCGQAGGACLPALRLWVPFASHVLSQALTFALACRPCWRRRALPRPDRHLWRR